MRRSTHLRVKGRYIDDRLRRTGAPTAPIPRRARNRRRNEKHRRGARRRDARPVGPVPARSGARQGRSPPDRQQGQPGSRHIFRRRSCRVFVRALLVAGPLGSSHCGRHLAGGRPGALRRGPHANEEGQRAPTDSPDRRPNSERAQRTRGENPMTTSNDPDEIRADIEGTRATLSNDVDDLAESVKPKSVAGRQVDKVKDAVGSVKDRVMGSDEDDSGALGTVTDKASAAKEAVTDKAYAAKDAVADKAYAARDTVSEKAPQA